MISAASYWIARMATVAAVLLGSSISVAMGQEQVPTLRLEEDLRLDANAEDFSAISRLYVGPRGQIVVPLNQDAQVLVFDSTGRRIGTVGRRGSGPGEFRSLTAAGWVSDTLWVFDGAQRRMTFVAPDGTLLRSVSLPATSAPGAAGGPRQATLLSFAPLAVFEDGGMLGQSRRESDQSAARQAWGERVLVNVSASGVPRVVGPVPDEHDPHWFLSVSGFGRYLPFAFRPQLVVSADGRRIAYLTTEITSPTGGTYSVAMLRHTGDTIFYRSYPFRGIPIPRRTADSAIAALAPPRGRPLEGPADLTSRFQALARERMPPVYAPVQSIALGQDLTVWVTMRDAPDGRETVVLNARGDRIGILRLSNRTRIWGGSASHLWTAESDTDGLVSIVRYRVVGLHCGAVGCSPRGPQSARFAGRTARPF